MSLFSYLFHSTPDEDDADLVLYAPVTGTLLPLSEVPDIVISEKIVGEGVAIMPESDTIVAPCDGVISRLMSTNHAFALRCDLNLEIYVTFGIGAVDLQGMGMHSLRKTADTVKKGDPILKIDLDLVGPKIKSTITSLVVVRSSGPISSVVTATGPSMAGTTPCAWIKLDKSGVAHEREPYDIEEDE